MITGQFNSSAADAIAITPDDDVDVEVGCIGFYVGVTGNVNVITFRGTTVLFKGVQAGSVIPIRVKRIKLTSTTATDIVGLW